MESDDEFEYAQYIDQEQRSSDNEPVQQSQQQAPTQMQRPQSRLAGSLPAPSSAAMQTSSLGFQYEPPPAGGYNPDDYEELPVSQEVQDLFEYILQYKPEVAQLETPLKPFIPDYIPAIGDIDEFIKVGRPDGKPDLLGLKVLDEPAAIQSNPSVLAMQLRHASKQAGASSSNTPQVAKLERPEKNSKRITEWIKSINDLHKSKPSSTTHLHNPMPDIETLMQQWPPSVEQQLQSVKLPDATLDVDLDTFVRIVCGILDIPVYDNPIESLHALFTLFVEFKNNPAFKSSLIMSDQRAPSEQSSRSQQHSFVGAVNQTVGSSSRQSGEILSLA